MYQQYTCFALSIGVAVVNRSNLTTYYKLFLLLLLLLIHNKRAHICEAVSGQNTLRVPQPPKIAVECNYIVADKLSR